MSCSLAAIERYMEALPFASPWEVDQHTAPIPWRTNLACPGAKRLKIAFVVDDGVVRVQPPIARAMREVIHALRAAGHEGMYQTPHAFSQSFNPLQSLTIPKVIEWDASTHNHAYALWEKAIFSDGGEACRKKTEMTGEPLIEGMLVGSPENTLTTSETHQLNADKYAYESFYLDRWVSSGIDGLIMPNTPWVGYMPWTWIKSHAYVGYTSIWNLLGYAALAVPVTTVSRTMDLPDEAWVGDVPKNASERFNIEQCMFLPFWPTGSLLSLLCCFADVSLDDVDLVEGMPVGLQVVGGRFGEEKCVAVAKAIEHAMKRRNVTRASLLT